MTAPSIMKLRRAELEARIEDLIELLDVLDGDENLEDGADDEPWLSGFSGRVSVGRHKIEYDLEEDGDEDDYSGDETDQSVGALQGGSGL